MPVKIEEEVPLQKNKAEDAVQGKRVIVLGDRRCGIKTLMAYLRGWGMEVQTPTRNAHLEAALNQAPPDLLVLDFLDLEKSHKLARFLQSREKYSHIPLLSFSDKHPPNKGEPADAQKCLRMIPRPIKQLSLLNAIKTIFDISVESASRENGQSDSAVAFTGEEARATRVLIAEDNPVNQKLVCRFLEKAGIPFDLVTNGRLALDAVDSKKYSIVLMDIHMPEMDGYQATEQIRKLEAERQAERLPIIALTASALKGDRDKCMAVGMDDYLTKPLNKQDLLQKVKRWVS
jgi:CheY-like chemotaxis protein